LLSSLSAQIFFLHSHEDRVAAMESVLRDISRSRITTANEGAQVARAARVEEVPGAVMRIEIASGTGTG
jgi:hypothetical protein